MHLDNRENIIIPLAGGRSTESVIRMGNTVHRTMSSNHSFIHKLLLHLEQNNFQESPNFLGISEENKEILSFIEGEVPTEISLSYNQMSDCIKLLKRFHEVCSTFELCGQEETICHNDFAPWNLIFKDGRPVGIIDFDDCKPGKRIEDVAYFLWTFLDLGNVKTSDQNQLALIVKLSLDYKLDDWTELIEAILKQQSRILEFRKEIVRTEEDQNKKEFSQNAIVKINTSIEWIITNRENLNKMLKDHFIKFNK